MSMNITVRRKTDFGEKKECMAYFDHANKSKNHEGIFSRELLEMAHHLECLQITSHHF